MNKFDDRVFLLPHEHETYMRRMPVRYVKHKLSETCWVCGEKATSTNPFERAHLIPFNAGVKHYRLTPDFLDSAHNIVTTHRQVCNKAAELSHEQIVAKIAQYI